MSILSLPHNIDKNIQSIFMIAPTNTSMRMTTTCQSQKSKIRQFKKYFLVEKMLLRFQSDN
jgi:hypothetical protein